MGSITIVVTILGIIFNFFVMLKDKIKLKCANKAQKAPEI
jgi:hypothetical protein